MFYHFRFIAPVVPLLIVFAAAGIAAVSERRAAMVLAAVLFVSTVMVSGITGRQTLGWAVNNGLVQEQVVAGWMINRNSRPGIDAPGGRRRRDGVLQPSHGVRHAREGGPRNRPPEPDPKNRSPGTTTTTSIGRSRTSLTSSSGSCRPPLPGTPVSCSRPRRSGRATTRSCSSPTRRSSIAYLPHPVTQPYLLEHNAVFVRDDSPEVDRVASWPVVSIEAEP